MKREGRLLPSGRRERGRACLTGLLDLGPVGPLPGAVLFSSFGVDVRGGGGDDDDGDGPRGDDDDDDRPLSCVYVRNTR